MAQQTRVREKHYYAVRCCSLVRERPDKVVLRCRLPSESTSFQLEVDFYKDNVDDLFSIGRTTAIADFGNNLFGRDQIIVWDDETCELCVSDDVIVRCFSLADLTIDLLSDLRELTADDS